MTSPFDWKNSDEPSFAMRDRSMRATSTGKSWSQVATGAISTRKKRGEKSPGYIAGLRRDERSKLRGVKAR